MAVASATPALAQYRPSEPPPTRLRPPVGHSEVNYYNNGALTAETNIPGGSLLWTSGAGGSGGDPVPCGEFTRMETETVTEMEDPDGPSGSLPPEEVEVEVDVEVVIPSLHWRYTEVDDPAALDAAFATLPATLAYDRDPWGLTAAKATELYGVGVPLANASRRFLVSCAAPAEVGSASRPLGTVDVPPTDPFWLLDPWIAELWNQVELDPFQVVLPDQAETYGGLVVNMPTWWQIDRAAWQPYYSEPDHHMGWDGQLALFPSELEFTVVPDWGDAATIPCAPDEGTGHDAEATPAVPDDLPRYSTQGQLEGWSCTWVPEQVGEVTVRATITYQVVLNISGFTEVLEPYQWSSDPLTLESGELRAVNVTPGYTGDE